MSTMQNISTGYIDDSAFAGLFCSFEAVPLSSFNTIWFCPEEFPGIEEADQLTRVAKRFACVIPGSECFDDLAMETAAPVHMQAERYGGAGIGDNAGGVRCGNIGAYQVKGIGRNLLVGNGSDHLHAYGGFSAIDATCETIVANTLGRLLPHGVANVVGLIFTARNAAYTLGFDRKRGWGALMVRSVALRPAHFLRAGGVSLKKAGMLSDTWRVRSANKALFRTCDGAQGFTRFLGSYLLAAADQFAFARMARIMHGSVSHSNICFDGRWIDLTNMGMVPPGINPGGFFASAFSFFEEHMAPVNLIQENIDTFNKYNGTRISAAPFYKFYHAQYQSRLRKHALFVAGLDGYGGESDAEAHPALADYLFKVILTGKVVRKAWPKARAEDNPLFDALSRIFHQLPRPGQTAHTADLPDEVRDLDYFVNEAQRRHSTIVDADYFRAACFMIAIKRCLLSEYFFRGRFQDHVSLLFDTDDIDGVQRLVHDSIRVAEWTFSGLEEFSLTLFDYEDRKIAFDAARGEITATGLGSFGLHQLGVLSEQLKAWPDAALTIGGYCFRFYLEHLVQELSVFARCSNG